MGSTKLTHLMFAVGGLVLVFVMAKATEWLWSYFGRPNDLAVTGFALVVGVGAAVVAWRNERVFTTASEISSELAKVSWPTKKETYAATIVVIVTVIVAAVILGIFDAFWSWLTGRIIS